MCCSASTQAQHHRRNHRHRGLRRTASQERALPSCLFQILRLAHKPPWQLALLPDPHTLIPSICHSPTKLEALGRFYPAFTLIVKMPYTLNPTGDPACNCLMHTCASSLHSRIQNDTLTLYPGRRFHCQILFTNQITTHAVFYRAAHGAQPALRLFLILWEPNNHYSLSSNQVQRAFPSLVRNFYDRFPNPNPGQPDIRNVSVRSSFGECVIFCEID